ADYVEIAPAPSVVFEAAARGAAHAQIPPVGEATLMNAPSITSEIAAVHARAVQTGGAGQHTINFSLLPVSPEDLAWLEGMLGEGRVGLFSTGYGKCMVMATALRHVWRVRYFDGANKVLLDTVEITRAPDVVLAAPDD
ncbi:hydrogenase expression/formation protein, partial [Xanthomonas citri pv. citri]